MGGVNIFLGIVSVAGLLLVKMYESGAKVADEQDAFNRAAIQQRRADRANREAARVAQAREDAKKPPSPSDWAVLILLVGSFVWIFGAWALS